MLDTWHWCVKRGIAFALVSLHVLEPCCVSIRDGILKACFQGRQRADVVVVSIYVNPTQASVLLMCNATSFPSSTPDNQCGRVQFSINEDFSVYPRQQVMHGH